MTRRITWTCAMNSQLIRLSRQRTLFEIAAEMDLTYAQVKRQRQVLYHAGRIQRLGRPDRRRWTPDEVMELQDLVDRGLSVQQIARRLKRSVNAIDIKATPQRARISRRNRSDVATYREVARIFGFSGSKITAKWVRQGWLKSVRGRQARRGHHFVRRLDLWSFVENPEAFVAWDAERITDPDLQAYALEQRAKHPRWLSVGEVARRYHVLHDTVNTWINQHRFPLECLVKWPNWWIREDALQGFVPPCERPNRAQVFYVCCRRAAPLELVFATDRDELICDDCRRRQQVYQLSNGAVFRVYPLKEAKV